MNRDEIEKLLDGTTPGPWRAEGEPWNRIVWSSAENRVCFMAHSSGLDDDRDVATSNLVAAAPGIARTALDAMARLEDAEAAQALVVERLRVPLQFMVDSIAEDKAYVAEKYPILFALIQARRAEMGNLGGVQVFGEIARDLLGILTADPSGVAALAALRAERDAFRVEMDRLQTKAMGAVDAARDAEAERDDALARLAAAEGRVAALTEALKPFKDMAGELFARNWNRSDVVIALDNPGEPHRLTFGDFLELNAALATVATPADTPEGRTDALRDFVADFAAAKIDALRYSPPYGASPEDEPDPVVDAETVWAWQADAKDALAEHDAAILRDDKARGK
jgi:hypothetical protein